MNNRRATRLRPAVEPLTPAFPPMPTTPTAAEVDHYRREANSARKALRQRVAVERVLLRQLDELQTALTNTRAAFFELQAPKPAGRAQ